MFVSPMTLIPPLWNIASLMTHRGRTKLSFHGFACSGQSRLASPSVSYACQSFYRSRQHQVIVTAETSTIVSQGKRFW